MDHRASFADVLLGIETDEPSDHQLARLREAKDLICAAKSQLPFGRAAVLVDEQYGSGVIRSAKEQAMILAIPIEASGRSWFTPQWGDAWLAHVERIAPDYAKVSLGLRRRRYSGSRLFVTARGFVTPHRTA